jgi:hypothetical protein
MFLKMPANRPFPGVSREGKQRENNMILLGSQKACSDCQFGTLVEHNLFERVTNSYAILLTSLSV